MKSYLPFLLIIISFFALFQLGQSPFHDWDESRHGVNAVEMLHNGDYINLYFEGKKDDWNLKPPLAIWAITLSFKFFGVNEFALRFPSAIAIILSFFFLFKIIRLYQTEKFAFFTCLILASVKGWIGFHVGRTGDTDALLLLFLMMSVYFYLQWLDFNNKKGIIFSSVAMGLAFLVKGPTMFIFLPGFLLYPFFTKKLKGILKQRQIYFGIIIFLLFPITWFTLVHFYGVPFPKKEGLGDNAFDSLFIYDIIERFTNPNFEEHPDPRTNWFFFTYLDARFNVWNYFFYVGVLFFSFHFLKTKQSISVFFAKNKLLLITLVFAIPLCLFMTFALTQRHWYLAPALPFIAIITYYGIDWIGRKYAYFKYLFFGVLAFTLIRQVLLFNYSDEKPIFIQENQSILASAKSIINIVPNLSQSFTLYLYQSNPNQIFLNHSSELKDSFENSTLIFMKKNEWNQLPNANQFEDISKNKESEFCILRKK